MIHILKLDSLSTQDIREDGDYEVIYTNLLRNGGYTGEIKHYETRYNHEFPAKVEPGDTVLLGGSRLDAFSTDEYTNRVVDFAKQMLMTDTVKLIGICYGHQIIGRALGAKVARANDWELGVSALTFTDLGKDVFRELNSGDGLQQVHLDQVMELPLGSTLLASSAQCPIQSFGLKNKYICIQGHPEFSTEITKRILERKKQADPAAYAKGIQRVELEHSGPSFGYALARLAQNS